MNICRLLNEQYRLTQSFKPNCLTFWLTFLGTSSGFSLVFEALSQRLTEPLDLDCLHSSLASATRAILTFFASIFHNHILSFLALLLVPSFQTLCSLSFHLSFQNSYLAPFSSAACSNFHSFYPTLSSHALSSHDLSSHFISYYDLFCHSCYSCHAISISYHVLSCRAIFSNVISFHNLSSHFISYYDLSFHVLSCRALSCRVPFSNILFYHDLFCLVPYDFDLFCPCLLFHSLFCPHFFCQIYHFFVYVVENPFDLFVAVVKIDPSLKNFAGENQNDRFQCPQCYQIKKQISVKLGRKWVQLLLN